ncbi:MAG: single-stranded DNA-binding protein [Actinomycetota bacterium]|nr:single-stranded DNA-binding protein [Actinomycetota bacterium]
MVNMAVVSGCLSRPAERRVLPSGSVVVSLEITVRPDTGPAETVPVAWGDAPAWASTLDAGQEIMVVGRVRRRFFRAAGTTQSRTEVVADLAVRLPAAARARQALAVLSAQLEAASVDLGSVQSRPRPSGRRTPRPPETDVTGT